MTTKKDLVSVRERVMFLMEKVPAVKHNYKLLLLLYWQVFDGINIPKEIIASIMEKGAQPQTINRSKRRNAQLLYTSEELAADIEKFLAAVK